MADPASNPPPVPFGWLAILRLGLVQAALGAVVVLTTSTLNRVMVVELALPAVLPGLLVGFHYGVQLIRPRMGFGADVGGRATPWILGGMVVLAAGGVLAALGTALSSTAPWAGVALAAVAFGLIGVGVSAAGTALLALLAKRVPATRRAAAATTVWLMMIFGFALTATLAGRLLDPFSLERMVWVSSAVSAVAVLLATVSLYGLEGCGSAAPTRADAPLPAAMRPRFRDVLQEVWAEPAARRFTIFVFVSMLAYSAQDLILEPFAALVHGLTPGETTRLSGLQHGGVLVGMLLAAFAGSGRARRPSGDDVPPDGRDGAAPRFGSLSHWMIGGCLASALAQTGLVAAGFVGPAWPLHANVFLLGVANGTFSIAAIASMMRLAGEGRASREGTRMGLWGAAQAIAFGLGGLAGAAASDVARLVLGSRVAAYGLVFLAEALLFVLAAWLVARMPDLARSVRAPLAPLAPAPEVRGLPIGAAGASR